MKKLVLFTSIFAIISIQAPAQKTDDSKVPSVVKASFTKQYPGIRAAWELEDGLYEASFKQKGHAMSVLYDKQGTITETETSIKVSELPAVVTSYVKTHRKGATIKEAARVVKANGEINYEAELKNVDLVFDEKGNFLKEERD